MQAALAASRPALMERGIYYPDTSKYFGKLRQSHHLLAHEIKKTDPKSEATVRACIDGLRAMSANFHTILLSSEAFYRHDMVDSTQIEISRREPRASRVAYVERMAAAFSAFDVEILVYLRKPEDFIESLYSEASSKPKMVLGFEDLIAAKMLRVDYDFHIDLFRKHFRKVTIKHFEDERSEGIVDRFFAHIGAKELEIPDLTLRRSPKKQASLWVVAKKRATNLTPDEQRSLWEFVTSDEANTVFDDPPNATFWTDLDKRRAFLKKYSNSSAYPGAVNIRKQVTTVTLSPEQERAADAAYAEYLACRKSGFVKRAASALLPKPKSSFNAKTARHATELFSAAERAYRTSNLSACVCVLTRDRPRMLRALMQSLVSIQQPENCDLTVLVVENGTGETSAPIIAEFAAINAKARIVGETEFNMGIPVARNTAVNRALEIGADLILFVDDDETVTQDWLVQMVRRYRKTSLMLIGGPVDVRPASPPNTLLKRLLIQGLERQSTTRSKRAQGLLKSGNQHKISLTTDNWLADARLFRDQKFSFDETMKLSGGSDMRLYRDARAAGIATGWAKKALVTETISEDRLSLAYQFNRAVSQSRVTLQIKVADFGFRPIAARKAPQLVLRTALLPIHLILLMATGGRSLLHLTHTCGWIWGQISAFLGSKSDLYRKTTGH